MNAKSLIALGAAAAAAAGLLLFLWAAIDPGGPEHGVDAGAPAQPSSMDAGRDSGVLPIMVEPAAPEATAPVQPAAAPVEPLPEPRVRLFGSVREAGREALLREKVELRLLDGEWEERNESNGGAGTYEVLDVQPGRWELTALIEGYGIVRHTLHLRAEEPEHRLDLAFVPATPVLVWLVGTDFHGLAARLARDPDAEAYFRSAGNPAPAVVLTREAPGKWLVRAPEREARVLGRFVARKSLVASGLRIRTDEASRDERANEPRELLGVLQLHDALGAHASLVLRDLVLRSEPVPAGASEVSFRFDARDLETLAVEVRLRVVDAETGRWPPGLDVRLEGVDERRRSHRVMREGAYVLEGVLPGLAALKISAPGFEPVSEKVRIEPAGTTDLGTYRLQRFARIRARVVDPDGKPVRAAFHAFPSERLEVTRETLAGRVFRSGEDGALEIAGIGRGTYLVLSSDKAWISEPLLVDTSLGDRENVLIRVHSGIEVKLRLRADPVAGARLSIRTPGGITVAERACLERSPMRFRLAPGAYVVELHDAERWLWSESLVVGLEPLRLYFPR